MVVQHKKREFHELGKGHQIRVREKRVPSYERTMNRYPNLLISSEPLNEHMKEVITEEHNRLRRIVPATDMRLMYWSDELAASAQRHANRCDFRYYLSCF
ncbi:unnamed protein product [Gongylonema pulchrum]|uniref:SCP domain-containing protein n=1 Tax=Gongylonema pulchrum TaxID=637853 RepID=A0A183DDD4_9BILA|nr:unnamed protein product [Gongylonema pulchrum]